MVFPRDVWNWLKKEIGEAETFLKPFVESFASEAGAQLFALAKAAVINAAADPSILTNADKRNAALADLAKKAEAAGIQCGETALMNAIQAAITSMDPSGAAVTLAPQAPAS